MQAPGAPYPGESGTPALTLVLRTLVPHGEQDHSIRTLLPLLSPEEQARAARFLFDRDRWSYAAAHALLRRMLCEYYGCPALDWRFRNGPHGRPEIDGAVHGDVQTRFSISHTHGMAACGITLGPLAEDTELGVDVEHLGRPHAGLAIAERFFSPREAALLRDTPPEGRPTAFLRLWTLKEAVAKALGLGLSLNLRSFSCNLTPPGLEPGHRLPGSNAAWTLHSLDVGNAHLLGLALRHPVGQALRLDIRHLRGGP